VCSHAVISSSHACTSAARADVGAASTPAASAALCAVSGTARPAADVRTGVRCWACDPAAASRAEEGAIASFVIFCGGSFSSCGSG
jgi:hypothetical protein